MHWRTIEELPSVTAAYDWLKQRLGDSVVLELEQFQQICKRKGVRLAKRGKPKGK
jgi:hypothetical protein